MPKGKAKKPVSQAKTCDLCCDTLEDGQDILLCEGGCNSDVHRYCAGVTKSHYTELASATPFICQFCTLNTYKAIIQQLQTEVEGLKSELASVKTLLKQQQGQTQARHDSKSYAAAASQSRGERRTAGKKKKQPAAGGQLNCESTERVGEPKALLQHATVKNGPRVRVEGARRVWGTMKHTTTKTIKNAISRFCKIESLSVRRKVRNNPSTQKESWWFVIHADEVLLNELESKWDSVNLQTSWVLQYCSKPAVDTSFTPNDDANCSVITPSSPSIKLPTSANPTLPSPQSPVTLELAQPNNPVPASLPSSSTDTCPFLGAPTGAMAAAPLIQ